ncbi:uncharacterized protein LOC119865924 [Canis lupus familiaris]|uniref:uncharacterized protein LOC119865924 n=1 Tax=Canis lupus familiaris TaxID=9615 RepID=UPI0018F674E5|nr:uncharacterized protein LOC119865924 [Canis lupus familiaris]XP_038314727.1 uncharacterized protein LOC119865924 [Canis lupus familiaris]
MTCAEDVGVDGEQRGAPRWMWRPGHARVGPRRDAPHLRSTPRTRAAPAGRSDRADRGVESPSTVEDQETVEAVGRLGRGWGGPPNEAAEEDDGSAGGHAEGRPRPLRQAGAPLPGSPQLPPSWWMQAGSGVWVCALWRPPQGPLGRTRWNQGLCPRPNGGAQLGLRGAKFPSPTGFGFELVPSSHSSPDKMEDVVSSYSRDGRWGDNSPRAEATVEVLPPPQRTREPPARAAPTSRRASLRPLPGRGPPGGRHALDREGAEDIEAASLLRQGRWERLQGPGRPGPSQGPGIAFNPIWCVFGRK